jgi:hypothetical protein
MARAEDPLPLRNRAPRPGETADQFARRMSEIDRIEAAIDKGEFVLCDLERLSELKGDDDVADDRDR